MSTDYINEKCWYTPICSKVGKECYMCTKYLEMNYLMEHSGLPKAKQKPLHLIATTKHDVKMFKKLDEIRLDIYNFVQEGRNLYITSDSVGNGKTSWAIKLLHKYFEEVWQGNCLRVRGMFVHVPTLLSELKDFNNPLSKQYKETLKTCDLVVWDDIASDLSSSYDINQLNILIDSRVLAEKANIYTGNLTTYTDLENVLKSRLASRIYKLSTVIKLDGEDNRDGFLADTE